jgi:hypothetical protein
MDSPAVLAPALDGPAATAVVYKQISIYLGF